MAQLGLLLTRTTSNPLSLKTGGLYINKIITIAKRAGSNAPEQGHDDLLSWHRLVQQTFGLSLEY